MWMAEVKVFLDTLEVWSAVCEFSNDERESGYDRALKMIFQRFNDLMIVVALTELMKKAREFPTVLVGDEG